MSNPTQPEYEAAAEVESALLVQAENAYLKQRVIHLNARVRRLEAEVADLTPDEPDAEPGAEATDPEPGSDEGE